MPRGKKQARTSPSVRVFPKIKPLRVQVRVFATNRTMFCSPAEANVLVLIKAAEIVQPEAPRADRAMTSYATKAVDGKA